MEKLAPVTPGELLLEEFLVPMGISRYRLAKEIGVPPQRIGDIVAGKRAVTADTDLRLCRFFGLSNGYWLRAQVAFDTEVAEEELAETLVKIKPWSDSSIIATSHSVVKFDICFCKRKLKSRRMQKLLCIEK
jgi:antitoxin HigA-1